jgi:hypothetical protein
VTDSPRPQPTVLEVSEHETLIVFPIRPGASLATPSDLPFEAYKHLLSDKPLLRPYRGEGLRGPKGSTRRSTRRLAKRSSRRSTKRASDGIPPSERRRKRGD